MRVEVTVDQSPIAHEELAVRLRHGFFLQCDLHVGGKRVSQSQAAADDRGGLFSGVVRLAQREREWVSVGKVDGDLHGGQCNGLRVKLLARMIAVHNVSKSYPSLTGPVQSLHEVTFTCQTGEFVCLVGPSGCGKSTVSRIMAGLEPPDAGQVLLDGQPVSAVRAGPRTRAMMFQDAALFPWLNVQRNVEFGLKMQGMPPAERAEIAMMFLKMMHLSRFAQAQPHELSGGMRQRVALARALAVNPAVLLMDEPFAALDAQTREIMHAEVQEVWQATGKTILFVTHNLSEAATLGTKVILMTARPGTIKEELCVDLPRPRDPRSPAVARIAEQLFEHLRDEIERVERDQFDEDWHLERKRALASMAKFRGAGI